MASTKVKIPTIDFCNLELKPNTPQWESIKVQVFEALKEFGCFEAIYDKVPNEIREGMFDYLKEPLREQKGDVICQSPLFALAVNI
ncbi:hypothetical protein H5410_000327 [Solanum commersonii]|uniref:2-oxoglutarate-dependent dioxygenase n=1 Tax=Solanum commersonii TaxID=4109 RepID=A0A9J6AWH3_SOLCO|nr:hypothetical protein H5410_000327 [Solanum commersonii]